MGSNTEPTCPDCGKSFDCDGEQVTMQIVCDACGCRFEADPQFEISWNMTHAETFIQEVEQKSRVEERK